jgi:acetolactate synthase I/II/III large subunit
MVRTGGQVLVESLLANGVSTVFGIPGVQLDAATDALHGAAERIRFVCARNEQATTYMADGYARTTGDVGVAMVVPGPGVLNALAGLATAYATSSRVLLLAGQVDTRAIGRGWGALHELPDQSGVLARLTKWSALARSADEVGELVAEAFRQLRAGRPRPVALELPPDVLAALTSAPAAEPVPSAPSMPAPAEVAALAARLQRAERPVLLAGGGVPASGAGPALTALAERLNAPVVVTENGRGSLDARHRLAFDPLALRHLRGDADLVVGVGTRAMTTFGQPLDVGAAALALVNAEPADLGAPRAATVGVEGDARLVLEALTSWAPLRGEPGSGWHPDRLSTVREQVERQLGDIGPQRAWLSAVRSALPEDGVFVSEFTQVGYAAGVCFPTYHQRGYVGPGYQGTLGFGFATALGVQAADPERAVVSVTGDGGFSWTLPELSTARRFGLGLITVLFEDGHFGNVRRIQKTNYGGRYFASDLTNPHYPRLADAFGVRSATATTPDELAGLLPGLLAAREPALVHVPVGEMPSPWHLIHEGLPRPTAAGSGTTSAADTEAEG